MSRAVVEDKKVLGVFSGALAVTNVATTSRTSAGLGGTTALLPFRLQTAFLSLLLY